MSSEDLAFYTRALHKSPESEVPQQSPEETFEWHVKPSNELQGCRWYSDGSRLDGGSQYAGLCARHGWATAAFDPQGTLVAAALGRPPQRADGIFGAELWGLLMSTSCSGPCDGFRVDCMSVQQGAQRETSWASAPRRRHARIWNPIAQVLEDHPERCVWMPAHCSLAQVGCKQLSDGSFVTETDITANALVDTLAKRAASADRVCMKTRKWVADTAKRGSAVAKWLGQATALANAWPAPPVPGGRSSSSAKTLRDSDPLPRRLYSGTQSSPKTDGQALAPAARMDPLVPRGQALRRGASATKPVAEVARRRSAVLRTGRAREELADATRVAQWISSLELAPASTTGPTAADRLEALKDRVRAKELRALVG